MSKNKFEKTIAYYCAEFGIDNSLPLYAGGLGILAGDYMKQAADMNINVVGIGLLYRGKFAIQSVKADGWQEEIDNIYDPNNVGLEKVLGDDGKEVEVVVNLTGEDVYIRAYKKTLGINTYLLLLTTENEKNSDVWKNAMIADYCCDDENQLRQMMVLGIGGTKLLHEMNIKPDIYHINEGRPIFLNWELIHQIMHDNDVDFDTSFQLAKEKTVYTNHTLLRAGNLLYHPLSIKKYASGYVNAIGEKSENLIDPGIEKNINQFSITRFALNISKKASAVSKIHGKLSSKSWPEYNWVTITNAVHMPTWQDENFRKEKLDINTIWRIHESKKRELRDMVCNRTGYSYDENRLVVTWSRRITDYKRLTSIFADITRLTSILKKSDKPVQLLVAGKGHYGDDSAKKTIQQVIHFMQNELSGCAIFVPNYNIELSQKLVSGSDIWLNTPEFGLEASGTSGMKAIANGVLNMTVADGWANEVDWSQIGWVLDPKNVSESFYEILENEASPLFYQRNENNIPEKWVSMMEKSIILSKKYSTERMLNDYIKKLYSD